MNGSTWAVVGLLTLQGMLAVLVISTPEALGLTPVVLNWLAIANVGIGVLLNQLEKLGGASRRVETVTATREVPGQPPVVQTVTTERTTGKDDGGSGTP